MFEASLKDGFYLQFLDPLPCLDPRRGTLGVAQPPERYLSPLWGRLPHQSPK